MSFEKIDFLKKKFLIRSVSENDHILRNIRVSGTFYECELLNYLRLLGVKGECAIDVGANIGNHSIFFSEFLSEYVLSIEANNEIIPILAHNLSANKCKCKIISTAVGAEPGRGEIYFPLENNIGAGKLRKGSGDINIMALDDMAPSQGVFLVKIDVEGMEMDVLRGAGKLISSQHPDFVIEASTMAEFTAIDVFLRPFGYRSLSRWNSTSTYHFSCNHGLWARVKVTTIQVYIRVQVLLRKVGRRLTHK